MPSDISVFFMCLAACWFTALLVGTSMLPLSFWFLTIGALAWDRHKNLSAPGQ